MLKFEVACVLGSSDKTKIGNGVVLYEAAGSEAGVIEFLYSGFIQVNCIYIWCLNIIKRFYNVNMVFEASFGKMAIVELHHLLYSVLGVHTQIGLPFNLIVY